MYFSRLHLLDQHLGFLAKETHNKLPLFLVGGVVRDILIGRNFSPDDIDATCPWNPSLLASAVSTKHSTFQTKKYGTLTIVRKSNIGLSMNSVSYEITPFREEWWYSDHRHPDDIVWSDDVLLDSNRRDFTVNCLYFTTLVFPQLAKKSHTLSDDPCVVDELFLSQLDDHGAHFVDNVLILQSHDLIARCFPSWVADLDYVFSLLKLLSPEKQSYSIGVLLDPHRGLQDIHSQKISCVGDSDKRIQEDALRILRALRFVVSFNDKKEWLLYSNFDFSLNTWNSLKKFYFTVHSIAKERIRQEILKAAATHNFFGYVSLLAELNLLKTIFPAVHANKHVDQPLRYHPFDVYHHLLLVLYHVEFLTDDPLLKLAALYHDVGKVEQYYSHTLALSKDERQFMYGSWINHVICGQDMVRNDFTNLHFSTKEIETLVWYVANHMKPGQIAMAQPANREKKLRVLLSDAGYEKARQLLLLVKADIRGQYNPLQTSFEGHIDSFLTLLDSLQNSEGQFTLKELAVNGDDVMKTLALSPWPEVKNYLGKAFDWVLDDITTRNHKDRILEYLAWGL